MPALLTDVLAEHTYDPAPVSSAVRKCASGFKKTHQDTWHEDSLRFSEDQLSALSTLLTGSSYCEFFLLFAVFQKKRSSGINGLLIIDA